MDTKHGYLALVIVIAALAAGCIQQPPPHDTDRHNWSPSSISVIRVPGFTVIYSIVNCTNVSNGSLDLVLSDKRGGASYPVPVSGSAIQPTSGAQGQAYFNLAFNLTPSTQNSSSYDQCGAAGCWDVPLAPELSYQSLTWTQNGPISQSAPISATLTQVDFDNGTFGVVFDCNNQRGNNVSAQLDKALLKRAFTDFKSSLRSILPQAISNGDLKDTQRDAIRLLDGGAGADAAKRAAI